MALVIGASDSASFPLPRLSSRFDSIGSSEECHFGSTEHEYDVQAIVTMESDPGSVDPNRDVVWRIVSFELIDARDRLNKVKWDPACP